MRKNPRRPWKMLLPLFGVMALAAVWSIYWLVAIGIARETAAGERQKLAQRGISLQCGQEKWGGYPFRFEFHCTSPVLTFQERLETSSRNLQIVALAYNPWQMVALLDGPTLAIGRNLLPMSASHQRIVASLTIGRDNQPSLSVDIPKVAIAGLMTADRVMLHTRPEPDGATGVAGSITKLNYQPAGRPELLIDQADFVGTITGDNTLNVEKIELAQGTVRYWGTGEVTIDTGKRLSGKLSTETNDLDGLLAILEPRLDISAEQKDGLRNVLGLLGNEAKADIIAREGQLYIGPFKVADLIALY
jgi:hypothetical protein